MYMYLALIYRSTGLTSKKSTDTLSLSLSLNPRNLRNKAEVKGHKYYFSSGFSILVLDEVQILSGPSFDFPCLSYFLLSRLHIKRNNLKSRLKQFFLL